MKCKTCNKQSVEFITGTEIKYVCFCGKNIKTEKIEKLNLPNINDEIKKILDLQLKLNKVKIEETNKLRKLIFDNKEITKDFLKKREMLRENIKEIDNKLKMIGQYFT